MEDWIHAKHLPVGPDYRDIPLLEVTWCCECGYTNSVREPNIFCHRCTLKFCAACASVGDNAEPRLYAYSETISKQCGITKIGVCKNCSIPEFIQSADHFENDVLYQKISQERTLQELCNMASQVEEIEDAQSSARSNESFVNVKSTNPREPITRAGTLNEGSKNPEITTRITTDKKNSVQTFPVSKLSQLERSGSTSSFGFLGRNTTIDSIEGGAIGSDAVPCQNKDKGGEFTDVYTHTEILIAKAILDQIKRRKKKLWEFSEREKRELEIHFDALIQDEAWVIQWLRVGIDWKERNGVSKAIELLKRIEQDDFNLNLHDAFTILRKLSRVYKYHAGNVFFESNLDTCLQLIVKKLRSLDVRNHHVELILESISHIVEAKNFANETVYNLFYILVDRADAECICWALKKFHTEWARDFRNRLFERHPSVEIAIMRQDEFVEGHGAYQPMDWQMSEKSLAGRTFTFMGKTVTKASEVACTPNSKSKPQIFDLGGIKIMKKVDKSMVVEQLVQRALCCMEDIVLSDETVKKLALKHKINLDDVRTTYNIFANETHGFIEMKNGRTLAHITENGGVGTYINETKNHSQSMRNLAWTFATSTLYAFVLRLGDRHNENLMVSNRGIMFHIDFGYCLDREPMDSKMILNLVSLGTDMQLPRQGSIMRLDYGQIYNAVGTNLFEKLFWPLARRGFLALRKFAPLLVEYVALIYSREDPTKSQPECVEKATRFVSRTLQPCMDDENAIRFLENSFRAAMDSDEVLMRDHLHDLHVKRLKELPKAIKGTISSYARMPSTIGRRIFGQTDSQTPNASNTNDGRSGSIFGSISETYNSYMGR